jgi:adenylate kinase family enzyme
MQRVLVIGCGGSGKSTFAAHLAGRLGLPLVHLDALFWRPGWVETPREQWAETVARVISGPAWILDGNYGGTLEQRLRACDTVIFLDPPRLLCAARVLRRWMRFRGRSRPDMSPGCPERISLAFLWWVLTYPERRRPEVLRRLSGMRPDQRVVVLRSPREVDRFLASAGSSPG